MAILQGALLVTFIGSILAALLCVSVMATRLFDNMPLGGPVVSLAVSLLPRRWREGRRLTEIRAAGETSRQDYLSGMRGVRRIARRGFVVSLVVFTLSATAIGLGNALGW
jgi:hypothetical protein